MTAAAAIDNARMRTRSGWPLLLLALAVYSPVDGLPRLALLATGLFFMAQADKARPARTPAKAPAQRSAPKPAPAKNPTKPKTATRAPRRRGPEGKWIK